MSYVQIEIGGKLRGLKFNQMAFILIAELTDPLVPVTGNYATIYAGLKANSYAKREEADFTFEQACDWTDSLTNEDWEAINKAVTETEQYKKSAAYLAENSDAAIGAKKKSATKSTKRSASK